MYYHSCIEKKNRYKFWLTLVNAKTQCSISIIMNRYILWIIFLYYNSVSHFLCSYACIMCIAMIIIIIVYYFSVIMSHYVNHYHTVLSYLPSYKQKRLIPKSNIDIYIHIICLNYLFIYWTLNFILSELNCMFIFSLFLNIVQNSINNK